MLCLVLAAFLWHGVARKTRSALLPAVSFGGISALQVISSVGLGSVGLGSAGLA